MSYEEASQIILWALAAIVGLPSLWAIWDVFRARH